MHLYPEVKDTGFPEIQRISALYKRGEGEDAEVFQQSLQIYIYFFKCLISLMWYIVLFSQVKAAVYYTKTKVHVLEHVHWLKLISVDPGLTTTTLFFEELLIMDTWLTKQHVDWAGHMIWASQLTWLVLSRNNDRINEFKLSKPCFKILKGGKQWKLSKTLQSREQYDYFRDKCYTENKMWGGNLCQAFVEMETKGNLND